MAISRIGGRALKANLERDSNLAFNTNTLVIDYTNGRIGIAKSTPTTALDVTGTVTASALKLPSGATVTGILDEDDFSSNSDTALATQQSIKAFVDAGVASATSDLVDDATPQLGGDLDVNGFNITSARSNENISIIPSGTGLLQVRSDFQINTTTAVDSILDEDNLTSNSAKALATQQSIKAYVDAQVAGGGVSTGMQITLGTPTDSSLTTDGAYQGLVTGTKVTDAIDELNEVLENIRNNTFVKSVSFTGSPTSGGSGFSMSLNISAVGNANPVSYTHLTLTTKRIV